MEQAKQRTFEQNVRSYSTVFALLKPLVKLIYPTRCIGAENIPEGAAIICANHSNYIDPLLAAVAVGRRHFIRFMAKKELRRVPLVGWILYRIGAVFVDRGAADMQAFRASVKSLKNGEKLFMFPEGTRSADDKVVGAKTGAIRLASRQGVPIVPVYIPRRKLIFGHVKMRIGEPYYLAPCEHCELPRLADELMEKIYALRDETP